MNIAPNLKDMLVDIDSVQEYPTNSREGDVGAIVESLKAHGQFRPILINSRSNEILAGNHTWKAAKSLGWDKIAVTYVDVDEEEAKRIVLIDNKTKFIIKKKDGSLIEKGSLIATIEGRAKNILIAERVALNFMCHISGIATKTNKFVKKSGKKKQY